MGHCMVFTFIVRIKESFEDLLMVKYQMSIMCYLIYFSHILYKILMSARLKILYQNQMLLPLCLFDTDLNRVATKGMKYKVSKITEYYGCITVELRKLEE